MRLIDMPTTDTTGLVVSSFGPRRQSSRPMAWLSIVGLVVVMLVSSLAG
jgi:hypothetical protein